MSPRGPGAKRDDAELDGCDDPELDECDDTGDDADPEDCDDASDTAPPATSKEPSPEADPDDDDDGDDLDDDDDDAGLSFETSRAGASFSVRGQHPSPRGSRARPRDSFPSLLHAASRRVRRLLAPLDVELATVEADSASAKHRGVPEDSPEWDVLTRRANALTARVERVDRLVSPRVLHVHWPATAVRRPRRSQRAFRPRSSRSAPLPGADPPPPPAAGSSKLPPRGGVS